MPQGKNQPEKGTNLGKTTCVAPDKGVARAANTACPSVSEDKGGARAVTTGNPRHKTVASATDTRATSADGRLEEFRFRKGVTNTQRLSTDRKNTAISTRENSKMTSAFLTTPTGKRPSFESPSPEFHSPTNLAIAGTSGSTPKPQRLPEITKIKNTNDIFNVDSDIETEYNKNKSSDDDSETEQVIVTKTYEAMDQSIRFATPEYTTVGSKRKMNDRTPDKEVDYRQKTKFRPLQTNPTTTTHNRYSLLSNPNIEKTMTNTEERERKRKPAPIIIKGHPIGQNGTTAFLNGINRIAKNKYTVKYTRFNTSVYFDDVLDKLAYQARNTTDNIEYYTYTERSEKQHAFVMKGLVTDLSEAEITEILKEKIPGINKVFTMRTKTDRDEETETEHIQNRRKMYMVIADNNTKMSDITKIKTVHYTHVTWEKHQNTRQIIQCHRCQKWGHATTNCNMAPRCLKCAGQHRTNTCTKNPNTPAKCANCEEAHPANSTLCRIYLNKLAQSQSQRQPRRRDAPEPKYRDAPLPAYNPWHQSQRQNQPGHSGAADPRMAWPPLRTTQETRPVSGPTLYRQGQHATQHQEGERRQAVYSYNAEQTATGPGVHSAPLPPQQPTSRRLPPNQNDFGSLMDDLKTLNAVMNIAEMQRALRDLAAIMLTATSAADKLTKMLDFQNQMSQYNI